MRKASVTLQGQLCRQGLIMTEHKTPSLDSLFADLLASVEAGSDRLPPVARWNPPLSGDIDIRIARNGDWFHEVAPIHREGLKRLFSSILKREGGDYYLVTPAEKWRIEVDDVPFFVTGVERVVRDGQEALLFETATGERVVAGQAHPLRVVIDPESGEPAPYLLVRDGMEGLLARGVFYQLADWACGGPEKKQAVQGVYSLGVFFPLE